MKETKILNRDIVVPEASFGKMYHDGRRESSPFANKGDEVNVLHETEKSYIAISVNTGDRFIVSKTPYPFLQ